MKRRIVLLITAMSFGCVVLAEPEPRVEGAAYVLQWPLLREATNDFDTKPHERPVAVTWTGTNTLLITCNDGSPILRHIIEATDKEAEPGLIGRLTQNDGIEIRGLLAEGGDGGWTVVFQGVLVGKGAWSGEGVFSWGVGYESAQFPMMKYKMEWSLSPAEAKRPKISNRVIHLQSYLTPPAPPPPISDHVIKTISRKEGDQRDSYLKAFRQEAQDYVQLLLQELTWEEMRYFPGIILLIDPLSKATTPYREGWARSFVRDGSERFFDGLPYDELQKVPPRFLLVKCRDKMSQENVDALMRVSPDVRDILDASGGIETNGSSLACIDEAMVKVFEKLPLDGRRERVRRSPKLEKYVAASTNAALRRLFGEARLGKP